MSVKSNPIGVMTSLTLDRNPFEYLHQFGLRSCQLMCWSKEVWRRADAGRIRQQADDLGVQVAACWVGYPGPCVWNFIEGPDTLGLVPPEFTALRLEALKAGADFAQAFGAPAIITHCGFIPFELSSTRYRHTLAAVRDIAEYCHRLGVGFWFETGQETPVVLLRIIQDLGLPNLGINLDPANLILYGMANPIDALDVFGPYVRCVHAKDGLYPTDGRNLGREVKVGTGKVNFPRLAARLAELNFQGAYIIEREISGPQQAADIAETVQYLRQLLGSKP